MTTTLDLTPGEIVTGVRLPDWTPDHGEFVPTEDGPGLRYVGGVPYAIQWAEQAAEQGFVNDLAADGAGPNMLEAVVRALAARRHARYSQYDGYWDTWTLGRATLHLEGKGGVSFEAGDLTLIHYQPSLAGYSGTLRGYSLRLGWNCQVSYGLTKVDR